MALVCVAPELNTGCASGCMARVSKDFSEWRSKALAKKTSRLVREVLEFANSRKVHAYTVDLI